MTETTAEIVCIICKDGRSARPNEIVLCDKCGIGKSKYCNRNSDVTAMLKVVGLPMCVSLVEHRRAAIREGFSLYVFHLPSSVVQNYWYVVATCSR